MSKEVMELHLKFLLLLILISKLAKILEPLKSNIYIFYVKYAIKITY